MRYLAIFFVLIIFASFGETWAQEKQNCLFSAEEVLKSELNRGRIPESLRLKFQENKISLSDKTSVKVITQDYEWAIDDPVGGNFIARVEAQTLNIYKEKMYNLKFVDTELEVFIQFIAEETGKRVLYDPSIRGKKVYLQSTSPVPQRDLMRIFQSIIEYHGYVLETAGDHGSELIKVKRSIQGPWTPTPTLYSVDELNKIRSEDQFVTFVVQLKNISAREVQTTLRALRIINPQGGNLAGIEGSNTILITDFAPNVKRVYDVIQMMDQKGQEMALEMVRLKYANPEEVVEKINQFASKGLKPGKAATDVDVDEIKAVADRRMNAVIVQAYPDKLQKIKQIISELDQPIDVEPSGIHYYQLKHADASRLEETLQKLLENAPTLSNGTASGEYKGQTLSKETPKGGNTSPTVTTSGSGASSGENVRRPIVQAELQTNSLIIKADQGDWVEIKKIIEQVDVRRPQVLLEAAVIELRPEDALNLGIELFYANKPAKGSPRWFGGTDFGLSNLVVVDDKGNATIVDPTNPEIPENAKYFGKVPKGNSPFGMTGFTLNDMFTIPALLDVMKTEVDYKILSVPRVLTNDHQQARVKVADADPTSTQTSNPGTNPTTSFGGYEEAGTDLLITPHISGERNYLRLDIEVKIAQFVSTSSSSASANQAVLPRSKTTREVTTSVTIPDGQTIVLGGQTQETVDESIQKLPILGDIPLLGYLFQSRVIEHKIRNIYIFITPHILREEQFKDLHKISYKSKMDVSKLGGNVDAFDPDFNKFQRKYGIDQSTPIQSYYMLDYKSPTERTKK